MLDTTREVLVSVTLHNGTTFLVTADDGDVHRGSDEGLYFQDSRFIARLQVRLDDEAPLLLTSRPSAANQALFVCTNPPLEHVHHKQLGLVRHRLLDDGLYDDLEIENYGETAARLTVSVTFEADFVHIFDVKQAVESGERHHERVRPPLHQTTANDTLTWVRMQREGLAAETLIGFSVPPTQIDEGVASFAVDIPPRARWSLWIHVRARADADAPLPRDAHEPAPGPRRDAAKQRRQRDLERAAPLIESDHPTLADAYRQAARDMVSLRMKAEDADGGYALAAGIPWYMALFGRDSLIASYQTLFHDPTLARGTLRALAQLQGTKIDDRADEQPGKILHEDRHGPLIGDPKYIPTFPYYGTIDATPLFLITLAEYVRCTRDLDLARRLRGNIERALDWMTRFGDRDGDGLLEYFREKDGGLANQGWKDSWDSVRFRDGRIAAGAIALVEVQGYAVRALDGTAEVLDHLDEQDEASQLRQRAEQMRARLDRAFWDADRSYFAEALDGEKKRVDAITSNPGHLLWCNAVSHERALAVSKVLLSTEMFSGYGIRTMAMGEGGFNPISYHNGSVWPHDTGLIAQGLSQYDRREEAARVVNGMLDALALYNDHRLPELFAGYPSADFGTPIDYPSANRPQAWASGAVILAVRTILGLDVDAFARRVTLRPIPIQGLSHLTVRGLPIGGARVEIHMEVRGNSASATAHGLPSGWSQQH